jgi:hypothetical protein
LTTPRPGVPARTDGYRHRNFVEPERRIELLTCSLRALPVWSWANVPELKPQVSEGAPTLADDPG